MKASGIGILDFLFSDFDSAELVAGRIPPSEFEILSSDL